MEREGVGFQRRWEISEPVSDDDELTGVQVIRASRLLYTHESISPLLGSKQRALLTSERTTLKDKPGLLASLDNQ